ncbi:putative nitrate ABC transporter, ATP-binding protein [Actinoplanes cyaneus]|uniref:Nitrate ABC transporter, ATP-binding protein n=1 Tax=Actinoplanes cyaneus TaxID=52696 RepID=A0A919IHV5_9ACTN|nr:ABC transporter ATP-binding protein [Actinoplanes cyaneus]MCW2138084.1 NitT/TauT family transport system ATP-binding protein [Actinoplanes cyaneus]GID64706.1 putative nitrate ABC transporter, ATP-binding protein [Actinoplanes cyaneus]
MSGLALRAERVSLGHGAGPVVRELDFDVRPGEVLAVLGASGCGKSTLLRSLAGLLPVVAGRLLADGEPVTGPSPERALMFQDDALLPWRTVRRNVELPLAIRGLDRAARRDRAGLWLDRVGLAHHADRLPAQLSGGMRQRVQLARTLAGEPRAVLMDEPFGALDAQTRGAMQRLLADVLSSTAATVVFVTHDVDEALFVADRVAVLEPGGVRTLVDVPEPRDPATRGTPLVRAARMELLGALGATDPYVRSLSS